MAVQNSLRNMGAEIPMIYAYEAYRRTISCWLAESEL